MYFTTPLYIPKIENVLAALVKSLKFPTSAKPSAPIKMAINLEVKKPAIIFITTETELREATLTSTLLFIYFKTLLN